MNAFDARNDSFFNKHVNATYGDLGGAVKKLVNQHTADMANKKNMNSIQDIQRRMENFSKEKAHGGMVRKHVAIVTELSSLVTKRKLYDISTLEQEMVCGDSPKDHFKEVEKQILNPKIEDFDKLRLGIIYCLRYETQASNISKIRASLRNNVSEENKKNVELVDIMLRRFGSKSRSTALFESEEKGNFLQKIKRTVAGINEIQNVFTQHDPLVHKILEKAIRRKLPLTEYPVYGNGSWSNQDQLSTVILVFCRVIFVYDFYFGGGIMFCFCFVFVLFYLCCNVDLLR